MIELVYIGEVGEQLTSSLEGCETFIQNLCAIMSSSKCRYSSMAEPKKNSTSSLMIGAKRAIRTVSTTSVAANRTGDWAS